MNPSKILTGRTRDVTISVDKGDLSEYLPQRPPATSGITYETVGDKLSTLANENKSMIIRMKVDADADVGTIKIIISKKDGTDKHTFDLEITKKIDSGPTPGDMEQVDAMWSVLPYEVTKVNFGRRTANSFYAIQLHIGNNTGFDLQIVGVGFDSALGRPAVDRQGKPLKPATDVEGNLILDEHGNKMVPALDNEGEPITEPITVDGKPLIVNGKPLRKPVLRPLKTYQLPSSDRRLVRGTIEFEQLYGRRASALNIIGGLGTFISGFIPFFRALNPRANFSTFSSIINGQLKEGFGIAAPDLTVSQLNRLDNVVLHDGLTIPNNSQAKTIVFFPRHILNLTKQEKNLIDGGAMYPVMDKLGELVIVGKPLITFRNREIVVTKAGAVPSPTPSRVSPPEPSGSVRPFLVNNQPRVRITGLNLSRVSEITINGVKATRLDGGTDSTFEIDPGPNPTSGDVIITSSGGTPTNVGRVVFPPRAKKAIPERGAANSEVIIEGANLEDVEKVLIGEKEALIKDIQRESGKLVFLVPEDARSAELFLKSPGYDRVGSGIKFVAQPVVSRLDPPKAGQGVKVTLKGYNFEDVSSVTFGNAEAKGNFEFGKSGTEDDPTRLIVTVPENAISGPISVTTKGPLVGHSKAFTFVPMPIVSSFPVSVIGGQELRIVGTNLGDLKELMIGNVNIPLSSIKGSPTEIKLTVPVGTANGKIKITTEGGTIESPEALTVTPPG
jgi:hypothetical protein